MRRLLLALLGLSVLAGCSFSVYDLPLPGGQGGSGPGYHVTVQFRDVLDLVPRSSVRVDDVAVGQVEKVWLDGWTANVRIRVSAGVQLPDNATAQIRQTSLLGEKFVSLAKPAEGTRTYGQLSDGDVIPLARTGRNVEVEEVLSALSLLLNGGGVAQLKTITVELNKTLEGRESDIRSLLDNLDTFIGELDEHKAEINRAIASLDKLSASLAKQKTTLASTIDELPAALTILADQRENLTKLLVELSKLGVTGTRVIEGTKEDLLANLKALDPVLTELAKSGDALPNALQVLFTYPFADSAANAVQGDYTNMQMTLDLNLPALLSDQGPLPLPSLPPLPLPTSLPTLPPLPTSLPTALPTLPVPLPTLPVPLPTALPTLPLPLPSACVTLPPLPLPPICTQADAQGAAYDPELAGLLVGGIG